MIISGLRNTPINSSEVNDLVTPHDGALVTFAGVTRADHNISALFYETWAEKASMQLRQIAEEATAKWSLHGALVLHRLDRVPIGETSVLCAAAAAHRDDAFLACRFLIDTLKETVAIWKREEFVDRTSRWVGIPDSIAQP